MKTIETSFTLWVIHKVQLSYSLSDRVIGVAEFLISYPLFLISYFPSDRVIRAGLFLRDIFSNTNKKKVAFLPPCLYLEINTDLLFYKFNLLMIFALDQFGNIHS